MKYLTLCLLVIAQIGYAQPGKHTSVIEVKNADFSKVMNNLIDQGFIMYKVDSNYKTIRTEFKMCPLKNGKPSLIRISFDVRIKDGITIISGRWNNQMFKLDEPLPIVNGKGAEKLAFNNMDSFARSLGDDVAYKR